MERYYHEFKVTISEYLEPSMIDIDLLSIESVESYYGSSILHMSSGTHFKVNQTKKEVMEIINNVNCLL